MDMEEKTMPPIHPGEVLMKEFLEPMGVTQYRLAKDISVPPSVTGQENSPLFGQ
jgi:antitoxin HigA-1